MSEHTYLALAYNYNQVFHWCRQHKIDPKTIRYVLTDRDTQGFSEFKLIKFRTLYEKYDPDFALLTSNRAKRIYWEYDIPIVEEGKIVNWIRS